MTLSDIRTVLLQQHDALRAKIERARRGTTLWREGHLSRDELAVELEDLEKELRAHHACEEKLLRDVLPTIDAWGPARAEIMNESHLDEHRNLCTGLLGATGTGDAESGAAKVLQLLASILEHMKSEEEFVLAPDVLTDDLLFGETFGG
jgi:hypothetical protein